MNELWHLHEVEQRARRWHVGVPEIVMHRLEVPQVLAGLRIDGDDRIGVDVVAGAVAAVVVGGGVAGEGRPRQVEETGVGDAVVVADVEAADELRVLERNDLSDEVMATPAIVDNQVYIRTVGTLWAFGR